MTLNNKNQIVTLDNKVKLEQIHCNSEGASEFSVLAQNSNPFGHSGLHMNEKHDSNGLLSEEARSNDIVLDSTARIKVIGVGGGGGECR